MNDETRSYMPEDDPLFHAKGKAFAVIWTLFVVLAAYFQYK